MLSQVLEFCLLKQPFYCYIIYFCVLRWSQQGTGRFMWSKTQSMHDTLKVNGDDDDDDSLSLNKDKNFFI
jgi:hypothetical protein